MRPAAHPTPRLPDRPHRQRGAALLTAMIIVTLVATLAAGMVWQQWRAVQVEQAERARTQAAWILAGALEFAKLILSEDGKSTNGKQFTALTEPWATPLAEARLSTFLAADKSNADDGPEAFLSGDITDAQSRYNLVNLVMADPADKLLKVDPAELEKLESLCRIVGIDTGVAQRIAVGLRDAMAARAGPAGTSGAAPLMPDSAAQLSWLGVDATAVQALQPFVVLLQVATPVNVNTASREVLAAILKDLDPASAERFVQMRQRTPFKNTTSFNEQLAKPIPAAKLDATIAVRSNYFEVKSRLRLMDRVLIERSLVHRTLKVPGQTVIVTVKRRERIAGFDQPAS